MKSGRDTLVIDVKLKNNNTLKQLKAINELLVQIEKKIDRLQKPTISVTDLTKRRG